MSQDNSEINLDVLEAMMQIHDVVSVRIEGCTKVSLDEDLLSTLTEEELRRMFADLAVTLTMMDKTATFLLEQALKYQDLTEEVIDRLRVIADKK